MVSVEQDVRPTWEEEGLPSVANMDVSAVGKEIGRASCRERVYVLV